MRSAWSASVLFVLVLGVSCASPPEDKKPDQASAPAEALTVNPNSGHGTEQVFTVRLQRAAGGAPPSLVGLLISDGLSGANACYMFNEPGTTHLLLVNDSGDGSRNAGDSGSVSNTQCDAIADQSASSVTADAIVVTFHARFKPGFKGAKLLFAMAQDANGGGAGLKQVGTFKVE